MNYISQNIQNFQYLIKGRGKRPTGTLSCGNPVGCRSVLNDFAGFDSSVRKRMRKKVFVLILISLVLIASSCKTKEVPGRRRTPRHCNSCTKWSYTPQETIEYELLHNDEG